MSETVNFFFSFCLEIVFNSLGKTLDNNSIFAKNNPVKLIPYSLQLFSDKSVFFFFIYNKKPARSDKSENEQTARAGSRTCNFSLLHKTLVPTPNKNLQELRQFNRTEAARARSGMFGDVFYSRDRCVCGLTTAASMVDPKQLSAGGASATSSASRVEGQSHRGRVTQAAAATALLTPHGPTPPLLFSPALLPHFLSSPLPLLFVPISCCRMLFQSACTS